MKGMRMRSHCFAISSDFVFLSHWIYLAHINFIPVIVPFLNIIQISFIHSPKCSDICFNKIICHNSNLKVPMYHVSLYHVPLSLLVPCSATAPCTMFRYRSLYHVPLPLLVPCSLYYVPLSLLVPCSAIAPCIMFRYRSLCHVPLSLLVPCSATAPCIMFRYRSLCHVPLPLLVPCSATAPCAMFRYRSLYHVPYHSLYSVPLQILVPKLSFLSYIYFEPLVRISNCLIKYASYVLLITYFH
jgi:hypothetical protein